MNEEMLEELLYFSEYKFPRKTIEECASNKISFTLLLKRSNENLTGNIDDVVLQMVYGNSRQPPGDEKSPAQRLQKFFMEDGKLKIWEDVDKENLSEEDIAKNIVLGIWAPPNSLCKATVLKLMCPNLSGPFRMDHIKVVPLHLALAYDAFKAKDIFELSEKHPGKVMSFGYFSSEIPGEAILLGKTTEKFVSRTVPVTYEEKLVIQLAKDDDVQCFIEFMDLGPSYVSADVEVGELDCQYFFPSDYNKPEAKIITFLKKKNRRKGKFSKLKMQPGQLPDGQGQAAAVCAEVDALVANGEQATEEDGEDTVIGDDTNNEEAESDDEGDEDENEDEMENIDKATSPIVET